MMIILKLFGPAKDAWGDDQQDLELPDGFTLGMLMSQFSQVRDPWMRGTRFAVNGNFVGDNHILQHRDEVAIIPPVSGG